MSLRNGFRLPGTLSGSVIGVALAFTVCAPTAGRLEAASPVPGRYKGETGARSDDGRISFRVDRRGKKISNLFVSAFVLCQDTFGNFGDFVVVASRTDRKKFRLSKSGRFTAKGLDKEGISYKVKGKLKGKRQFKGTVRVSLFRTKFDLFFGLTSELCSGSRNWRAKR